MKETVYIIDNGGEYSDHQMLFISTDRSLADVEIVAKIFVDVDATVKAVVRDADWLLTVKPLSNLLWDFDVLDYGKGLPKQSFLTHPSWILSLGIEMLMGEYHESSDTYKRNAIKSCVDALDAIIKANT